MPFYLYLLSYNPADQAAVKTLLKAYPQLQFLKSTQQELTACYSIDVFKFKNNSDWPAIKSELLQGPLDFIKTNDLLNRPKLAVFDMDSTLIPVEVIDRLAAKAGVGAEVAAITEAAMQGELDFNQSLAERVKLLKGLSQDAIESVAQGLTFNPGIEALCDYLLQLDAKLAIASGGFVPFAKKLQKTIPFSEIKANQLVIENGQLTGELVGTIINAEEKARALKIWAEQFGLSLKQTLAVGDGANDLKMLQAAGLGVAYHAKPKVNQSADAVIKHGEINALVDLFEQLDWLHQQITLPTSD